MDGWATSTAAKTDKKEGKAKEPKEAKVTKPKKQTPQEIEEEMRKLREAQARWREEQERKKEEMKKKRIEERQKEKERKVEERRLVKELMEEWSARREDLECEDLRALPVPTPVRCRVPNRLAGEVLAILEFIHSFAEILEVKDSYPGQGVTFQELEKALTETETADGAFFDILSFMLVTVFDLQLEEEEEAKADTDKTWDDVTWAGDLGKDEVIAAQIHRATEVAAFTRQSLGCTLREVHLDQFSITEVLRLHLEGSGGYRGWNLQNWRHNNRGGYKLQDDPGFQFCLDEPQVVATITSPITPSPFLTLPTPSSPLSPGGGQPEGEERVRVGGGGQGEGAHLHGQPDAHLRRGQGRARRAVRDHVGDTHGAQGLQGRGEQEDQGARDGGEKDRERGEGEA